MSLRATHLTASDFLVLGLYEGGGGTVLLARPYLARSKALRLLAKYLERAGAWTKIPDAFGGGRPGLALELRVSPPHAVSLSPSVCHALGIATSEEVHSAWVYPVPFSPYADGHTSKDGSRTLGTPALSSSGNTVVRGARAAADVTATDYDEVRGTIAGSEGACGGSRPAVVGSGGKARGAGGVAATGAGPGRPPLTAVAGWPEEEVLDPDDPDVSFVTVGGFIYFRPYPERDAVFKQVRACKNMGRSRKLVPGELLSACSIRFSPSGSLQFSAPRRWEPAWTTRMVQRNRFQPVSARKWSLAGARFFCWLRPNEPLPDARGRDRPLVQHGGLAFLFHDLAEPDVEELDRYFEVVSVPKPCLSKGGRQDAHPSRQQCLAKTTSLPYNLAAMPPTSEARLPEKILVLAKCSRWPLVRHLLAEYPHLATVSGDGGTTLLHICAMQDFLDTELLGLLKELGAAYDATDAAGRRAEDLGGRAFRAVARNVWGVSPDLFKDPEAWFEFWDRNSNCKLEPGELGDALACAFRCDAVGTKWVKSYVNIHHRAGITKAHLLSEDGGLLRTLQTSEAFAGLQQQKTPPLFHGRLQPLTDCEHAKLMQLEERLEQMRLEHGWKPGKPAPPGAKPLPLPAPSAEGSADPAARMRTARSILGFSFEQTRALQGRSWQTGFRIDFAGQQGLDDGGLTKAWVTEVSYALWGDNALFDTRTTGSFFKADEVESILLDDVPVRCVDLYRWIGRFVAYALYQRCLMDCRLCAWVFRTLHRFAQRRATGPRSGGGGSTALVVPEWPDTPVGEDAMLDDLASLDHTVASNLWRVLHEMSEEELRWLDFSLAGKELEPGGAEREVTPASRAAYVRLCCNQLLRQRSQGALQAFSEGFFEVVPARMLEGTPEEGVLRLLAGEAEVNDAQLCELERVVVPHGLVPDKLREHPRMLEAAGWLFQAIKAGDSNFRSRLLEFWIGVGRVPLTGLNTVLPKPRLQVMVQPDGRGGVKRIASWPKERLPEGHTCGNELWIALPDSLEELTSKLRLAVENFEAGFSLR